MRDLKNIIRAGFLLFLLTGNSFINFSQSFEKSLRSKLSKEDQKKYLKCDKLMAKGYAIIQNNPFVPDTVNKKHSASYIQQNHQIAAYYLSHMDASLNFKFAIELKYDVLNKNIKAFWKSYKGSKKGVKWVVKVDDASFDSLMKADKIRQEADEQVRIADKIPLLKQAEIIEENAEFRMEKVLFICQNLPMDPIPEWLASADTLDPLVMKPIANAIPVKPILTDSLLNSLPVKDTSFYSLLHIGETQVDLFNDFLLEKFPDQVENYVMDFEQLQPSKIDSLQEDWNNFVLGQYVTSDTSLSNVILKKNSPVQALAQLLKHAKEKRQQVKKPDEPNVSTAPKEVSLNTPVPVEMQKHENQPSPVDLPDFFYRLQIAACRDKLSPQELKRRCSKIEDVVLTFEDDWYKYTIGSFSDYKSARELRDRSNIKGAFVVAYLNGKRIHITPYLISMKHPKV